MLLEISQGDGFHERYCRDSPRGSEADSKACRTRRWSRLAIASCGMVSLLAASCSTFSLGNRMPEPKPEQC